ncbi:hypothetical protein G7046_g2352 [Stylonectria norvegica]|nr:hypothetical protein G7046_g2352 [Stylonectria norvegica]
MASYLITGTGRGLGLALSAALAAKPASEVSVVYAAFRTETEALKNLVSSSNGRVQAVPLDVTDPESVKKAASQVEKSLGGKGLDVLYNNAGVMNWTPNGIATMEDLVSTFNTNVVGVQIVSTAFAPLLEKGTRKQIINVSTPLGSIAQVQNYAQAPTPAYKITKSALNMLTVQWSLEYGPKGFTVVAISPGWLRTDLGSDQADLSVDQGVAGVLEIEANLTKEKNGKFLNINVPGFKSKVEYVTNSYDGEEIPW